MDSFRLQRFFSVCEISGGIEFCSGGGVAKQGLNVRVEPQWAGSGLRLYGSTRICGVREYLGGELTTSPVAEWLNKGVMAVLSPTGRC
eukprot:430946-Pyramimonas_sp.AAC.1